MAQNGIGVMLKRLFVKPESTPAPEQPEPEAWSQALAPRNGPPLLLLVPGVAGISIYHMRLFDDAHTAAAFIESCDPYRIYKEGIIAFWALHDKPPHDADAECAVLVRTEPASDLVHAYAFADLETASSYVRFRTEENSMPPETFMIYWAASVRIHANPSGEVRLEPALPPVPVRDMEPAIADSVALPDDPAEVVEQVVRPVEESITPPSMGESEVSPSPAPTRRSQSKGRPTRPVTAETHWSIKPGVRKVSAKLKANVLAMGLMGFAARDIEKELRAMYPGDRVPAYATISRWLRRAGLSRTNLKKWETMSEHAMRILEARLAELEDAPLDEVARIATLLEGMRRK